MQQISVIIPFYQREPGVLPRALASIYAQDLKGVRLEVIVVDDASPVDAAGEIAAAGAPPEHVGLQLIRQANGGPGAARNTGLAAVSPHSQAIALLDSDDMWAPDHLRRAQAALEAGLDLYFCNHCDLEGRSYFETPDVAARLAALAGAEATKGADLAACTPADLAAATAEIYLAHTSSIVFDPKVHGATRFDEVLRSAGEDHLFFLDLALGARRCGFGRACGVRLGRGVNIYGSAQTWGTPEDLRRRTFNLYAKTRMMTRTSWPQIVRQRLAREAEAARRTVGYLALRGLVTRPLATLPELRRLVALHGPGPLLAPLTFGQGREEGLHA